MERITSGAGDEALKAVECRAQLRAMSGLMIFVAACAGVGDRPVDVSDEDADSVITLVDPSSARVRMTLRVRGEDDGTTPFAIAESLLRRRGGQRPYRPNARPFNPQDRPRRRFVMEQGLYKLLGAIKYPGGAHAA
jgi:hypothetical protein